MVEQKPQRESIEKCAHRHYKKKNARVQKKLAELGMASKKTEQVEDDEEYDSFSDSDKRGELHKKRSLKQNGRRRHALAWPADWNRLLNLS